MKASTSHRVRSRLGAALIAGSLGAAVLAVPSGGLAQEAPEETETLEVVKDAIYAQSSGEAAPDTVTSEFPPGVVCLVFVSLCNDDAQQITGPVNEQLQNADAEDTPDDSSPQQFRAPNTITVAQNSGEQRYAAGIEFALPEIPSDEEVVSATLVLTEVRPTYHTSSPFFRQMMLAALAGVRDQEAAFEEAQKAILNPDTYPATEVEVGNVGVEVCPFTTAFSEGTNNWDDTPGFDCIFGANGTRVEVDGGFVWVFDLTFTLQAWRDETVENHGLYVRATKAPNLAFGDPDTSWQAQISFGSQGHSSPPALALQTAPASDGSSSFVPPPATPSGSGGAGSGSSSSLFPPSQGFPTTSTPTTSAPVQEPGSVVAPAEQPATQPVLQAAPASAPTTPWWVWLLVPTFLLGMFMVSQSLTAEVQAVAAREGAMTRLIRQRNGGDLATSAPQFQV